jgi:hypothetical protein
VIQDLEVKCFWIRHLVCMNHSDSDSAGFSDSVLRTISYGCQFGSSQKNTSLVPFRTWRIDVPFRQHTQPLNRDT